MGLYALTSLASCTFHAHGSWSRLRASRRCAIACEACGARCAHGAIPIYVLVLPDVVHLIRITDRNYLELVKAAKRRSVSSVAFGLLSVAVGRLQTESPVAGEFLV